MNKKIIVTGLLIITVAVFLIFKLFIQEKIFLKNQPIITENSNLNNETSSPFIFFTDFTPVEQIEESFDPRSELCENYKEIQDFEEPIPVIWEAKLTGCLMSCYGAHFTRIPETENSKYPRFAGYYPDEFGKYAWDDGGNGGNQIPEKFLEDGLNLKIYGKWLGIDYDHPYTVFGNKCVPILEIEKIEKL